MHANIAFSATQRGKASCKWIEPVLLLGPAACQRRGPLCLVIHAIFAPRKQAKRTPKDRGIILPAIEVDRISN